MAATAMHLLAARQMAIQNLYNHLFKFAMTISRESKQILYYKRKSFAKTQLNTKDKALEFSP